MEEIFKQEKITDQDNKEHEVFTDYRFNGEKYIITRDGKVFKESGKSYVEASKEESKKLFDTLNEPVEEDYVVYEDDEEER